jgi:hypothetical protein
MWQAKIWLKNPEVRKAVDRVVQDFGGLNSKRLDPCKTKIVIVGGDSAGGVWKCMRERKSLRGYGAREFDLFIS